MFVSGELLKDCVGNAQVCWNSVRGLAEIRDQWSKMVQFFQMTSNIIDVCLNKSVTILTEQVKVMGKRRQVR